MTTRPKPWNEAENTALVALYFRMLDAATAGQPYNKAAMIREARGDYSRGIPTPGAKAPLIARSSQSIEFKLMNATAAHQNLTQQPDGTPTTETMHGHGYRAMPNYRAALKDAMRIALRHRRLSGRSAA